MASTSLRRSTTLAQKVAVVTASSDGIGYAIARRLGSDGAKVVISSRKRNNVDKAVAQLQSEGVDAFGTVCHMAKEEDRKNLVQKTLEKYGKIDILVSNAAVCPVMGDMVTVITEELWDKMFDVNLKSAFFLIKDVVGHMRGKKINGAITLVSSVGGYTPFQFLGAYNVTKTALFGLTKVLSNELASDGIRVNCIAPGLIKTNFSQPLWENEAIRDGMLAQIPMRRIGTPEECAGIVSFLSSDDASYITGENIVVAGGYNSRL